VINVKIGLIKTFLINNNIMAEKKFPEIKEKNQGKFTAWAKRNGFKDACSAASAVMKNKDNYKPAVVKMANYANNFGCKTSSSPMKQKGALSGKKLAGATVGKDGKVVPQYKPKL
jgi:hypothetical protein